MKQMFDFEVFAWIATICFFLAILAKALFPELEFEFILAFIYLPVVFVYCIYNLVK